MIIQRGNIVYHTSAGGYIYHQGKILLVKNYYHGGIIPPHGHKEIGETLLQTAKRELCEETGYCFLKPLLRLGYVEYTFFHEGKKNKKREYRWLFALEKNKIQKKQTEEGESLENRWYTIDQAIRHATFENTKQDLRKIKQFVALLETKEKKGKKL